jgi:hypothetical protein
MTSGTKDASIVNLYAKFTRVYIGGVLQSTTSQGTSNIGLTYVKTWNGADYPSAPVADVFGRYFYLLDNIVDANAPRGYPKRRYVEKWLARRQPKRQTTVPHSYSMSLTISNDSPLVWTYGTFAGYYEVRATTFDTVLPGQGVGTDAWTNNNTIALQGKLRAKIAGSDFDCGVFLGEGRQTLNLLADNAKRLTRALSLFRKGDVYNAARSLGASEARARKFQPRTTVEVRDFVRYPGQWWLELQYGWKPLVDDMFGGAQSLAHQLTLPYQQRYRVRSRIKMNPPSLSNDIVRGGDYTWTGYTYGQLIGLVKEINVPALNGLADPSSVLWELTPWSFVADWVIPIGAYLEARGLAQAISGNFVTTLMRRQTFNCYAVRIAGGNPLYTVVTQPFYRRFNVSVTRSVDPSLFTPRPNIKPFGKVASWMHCANALALLVTGFSGGRVVAQAPTRAMRQFKVNLNWDRHVSLYD